MGRVASRSRVGSKVSNDMRMTRDQALYYASQEKRQFRIYLYPNDPSFRICFSDYEMYGTNVRDGHALCQILDRAKTDDPTQHWKYHG